MQKSFSLQHDEQRDAMGFEDEQRNLLAQLGSMSLQKKAIMKRLPEIEEEQRKLVRRVVARVGVEQFSAARIANGNVLVDVPDELPIPSAQKVNGAVSPTVE